MRCDVNTRQSKMLHMQNHVLHDIQLTGDINGYVGDLHNDSDDVREIT